MLRIFILLFLICTISRSVQSQRPYDSSWSVDSIHHFALNSGNKLDDRLGAFNLILWKVVYTDWNKGYDISASYYELAKENGLKVDQIKALHFFGFCELMKGEIDSAFVHFNRSYELARQTKNFMLITQALNDLGNLEESRGDLNKAFGYYKESYTISIENDIKLNEARSLINMANVYELQGKYKASLETCEKALAICREHNYSGYLSSVYELIGNIYLTIHEFELARKYFKLSYDQSFNPINLNKRLRALENMATLEKELNNYSASLDTLTAAMSIAKNLNANQRIARINYMRAEIFFINNDLLTALKFFEASLKATDFNSKAEPEVGAYLIGGKINFSLKRYREAEVYLLKAHELAGKNRDIRILRSSSKFLYLLYKDKGELKKSYQYLEEFNRWMDIERDKDEVKQILKRELNEEFNDKSIKDSISKIKEFNRVILEHQKKVDHQRTNAKIAYGVLTACILLLLLGAFILYRNKRNRQLLEQKNQAIEKALNDNEILLKEVNHRVKNNLQIVASLLHLKLKNVKSDKAREPLLDSKLRINAMMIAHQRLYQNNNYKEVEIIDYCKELANMLKFQCDKNCEITVSGPKMMLNVEKVQAIGFIVHELVTNSIKYAWKKSEHQEVGIEFKRDGNKVNLYYHDNGIGLPENFCLDKSKSFGMGLVHSIATRQLLGGMEFLKGKGTRIHIKFELDEEEENSDIG